MKCKWEKVSSASRFLTVHTDTFLGNFNRITRSSLDRTWRALLARIPGVQSVQFCGYYAIIERSELVPWEVLQLKVEKALAVPDLLNLTDASSLGPDLEDNRLKETRKSLEQEIQEFQEALPNGWKLKWHSGVDYGEGEGEPGYFSILRPCPRKILFWKYIGYKEVAWTSALSRRHQINVRVEDAFQELLHRFPDRRVGSPWRP